MRLRKLLSRLTMVVTAGTLLFGPVLVHALSADHLLITELQTGSTSSASQEFIELYNPTDQAADLTGWKLQYASAGSSDWSSPSRNIALSGSLGAGAYYLLASSGYLTDMANQFFSAGIAKDGGHIRLAGPSSAGLVTVDKLGWGSASMPETTAVAKPQDGQSLQRAIVDDEYIDTDSNQADFTVADTPSPGAVNAVTAAVDTTASETNPTTPSTGDSQSEAGQPGSITDTPVVTETENPGVVEPIAEAQTQPAITELLPDPVAPATDADDEFIELYNPNSVPFALAGYRLQTGTTFSHSFTFGDETLPPFSYVAFYSRDTNLSLANNGGQARLLNPNGDVVSSTDPYGKVPTGSSWANIGGAWQWTISPTPNLSNALAIPSSVQKSSVKSVLGTSTKKASTAKPKTTSTKSTAKTTAPKTGSASGGTSNLLEAASPLHPTVLAGVAILAVGYAVYEYRDDLTNRLYQFKRYRTARREARS